MYLKELAFRNSYADTFHENLMNDQRPFSYPLARIKHFDMRKGRENKMVTML
jgi:hypothetical protein